MNRRPLAFASLALMTGLWLGRAWPAPLWLSFAIAAAAAAAFVAAHLRRRPTWRSAALCMLFLALGAARMAPLVRPALPPNHLSRWLSDRHLPVEGVVNEPPIYHADGSASLTLEAAKVAPDKNDWTRAAGQIAVHVRRNPPALRRGETVRLDTPIHLLTSVRTPGVYDTSWDSISQGVYLEGYVLDGDRIERAAPAPLGAWSWLDAARDWLRASADRAPGAAPWVVRALVLGEQSLIDPLVRDAFYRTGIIHVLVVSGLNIAAVAGLLYLAIWFLLTRRPERVTLVRPHRWAAAIAAPFAVVYTLLAGGATSVMRACVMFLVLTGSLYFGRRRDPLTTLAFAAIVTLLLYPGALWQAGFQFSFVAVLGMMHWRRPARWFATLGRPASPLPVNRWLDGARRWVLSGLAYSLAAYFATAPIALWHYGQLATAAPLANYVAIPLFSFVSVPFALLGCVAGVVSQAAANALWAASAAAVDQVYGSALLLEALGARVIQLGRPNWLELATFALIFAAVPYLNRRRVRRAVAAGLALLALLPIADAAWERAQRRLSLTMLDVGQGLSMFVRAPAGRTMLIDGGFDPRGRAVTGFLSAQRVSRLDVLVATHPHPDHCNGLAAVLERFPVGEIWTIGLPRAFAETGPCLLALEQAKASGVLVRTFSRADPPFAWSGVGVNVLNPPLAPPPEWELNDRSLALRIAANGAAALLTADMERPAEESLLAEGGDVSAGVVQVGHHGSYSSSTEPFVAAVRPAHALFPVGFQNQYHLPRAEIVERWRMIGAQIWRTDRDGAIECVARAGEWSCRSIAPAPSNPLLRL